MPTRGQCVSAGCELGFMLLAAQKLQCSRKLEANDTFYNQYERRGILQLSSSTLTIRINPSYQQCKAQYVDVYLNVALVSQMETIRRLSVCGQV